MEMIQREHFKVVTKQKGQIYKGRKITNNSNHIVLYKGDFVGEVRSKSDSERLISNLIKYQRMEYTQEF